MLFFCNQVCTAIPCRSIQTSDYVPTWKEPQTSRPFFSVWCEQRLVNKQSWISQGIDGKILIHPLSLQFYAVVEGLCWTLMKPLWGPRGCTLSSTCQMSYWLQWVVKTYLRHPIYSTCNTYCRKLESLWLPLNFIPLSHSSTKTTVVISISGEL